MKQLIFLSVLTFGCGIGAFAEPFWGIFLYYIFAVLRPQYLWKWALPFDPHWSLIAAGIVFVSLAVHLPRLLDRSRLNVVILFLIAYAGMVMLTMITANYPLVSQHWAIDTGKIVLMAILASLVIDRLWQLKVMAMMIFLSLGTIAYEVNTMYYFQHYRLDIFHFGFGGFDNNGAGLLLALGIPFAYCFAFGAAKGAWRLVRYASPLIAMMLIQAVMLTYSRGAMVAAVLGLGWLTVHHRPRIQAAALGAVVLVIVAWLAGPQIRQRFWSTEHYRTDKSAETRLEAWTAAWDMAWEHPLLGTGVRNSQFFMKNYDQRVSNRTVHSQYLQMAADSGIVTAGLYLAMLIAAMVSLTIARRDCLRWLDRQRGLDDTTCTERSEVKSCSTPGYAEQHDLPYGTSRGTPHTGMVQQIQFAQMLCLAMQSSLIIFAVGSVFLSVEDFEAGWLLIVLAGVMPGIIRHKLGDVASDVGPGLPGHVGRSPVRARPDLQMPELNTSGIA